MTERTPAELDLATRRMVLDDLDLDLLELIVRRRALVAELFEHKRAAGLPLLDPERERALLAARRAAAERLGMPADLAERIFQIILEGSHAQAGVDCGRAEPGAPEEEQP